MLKPQKRSPFSRNAWLIASMFVAMAAVLFAYLATENRIEKSLQQGYRSGVLADELRQSSDDLSRMARVFVAIGDPVYKQYFRDILDIRDGKQPRPDNYQLSYWDQVIANGAKPRTAGGQAIGLLERIRQTGLDDQVFDKLALAKANSEELARTEWEVMAGS